MVYTATTNQILPGCKQVLYQTPSGALSDRVWINLKPVGRSRCNLTRGDGGLADFVSVNKPVYRTDTIR